MGYPCTGVFDMEYFQLIAGALAELPFYAAFLPFGAAIVCAAVCVPLKKRGLYRFFALLFLGAGIVLLAQDPVSALVFLGLYLMFALLLDALFLIRRRGRKRETREERIYKKFHTQLGEPPCPDPPKICCFEDAPPEENGMELSHVIKLMDRLRREKLSSADRLELEVLRRTVEGAKGRTLTPDRLDTLNDCLASVLRLTAKYKL